MRVRALWSAVGVAAGLFAGQARAGVIVYATGFEDPPFAAGSQLVGQDGWVGVGILSPAGATITNTVARTGAQSVQVRGADLVSQGAGSPIAPYDAVGSYRRPVNHAVTAAAPLILVEADLRLDGPGTTATDFFSVNIAARSGGGETLGEFALSSNGLGEGYGFDVGPGDPPAFTTPINLNQWYHVTVAVDFAHRTTSYYLDGALVGTISSPSASDVLLRGAVVAYALPDGGGDSRADYTARADNFTVTANAVPEPAGMSLLAVGGLGLLGYARRRVRPRQNTGVGSPG